MSLGLATLIAAATPALSKMRPAGSPLVVHFVRHGQATHNVRAEVRREEGCSHEEFIAAMQADDQLDADLTDKGRAQARAAAAAMSWPSVELVVCSPLSRAIETAALVFRKQAARDVPFVCNELLREWSGLMENARRRPSAELRARFPRVDFSAIPETDESWTEELEPVDKVAGRGLLFLEWLARRPEREIAVVAHGGIYSSLFAHAAVRDESETLRPRFGNCDVRTVEMTMQLAGEPPGGRVSRFSFRAVAPAQ